jgi:O-antigen ligase
MELRRVQLGLVAAIAATCPVSIFAAQVLLTVAVVVYLARLVTGQCRLERLPLDGPILAFSVWTLLSASFSPSPLESYESAKKLVLFALIPLAVETLAEERSRERVLDAALLGGLALSAGTLLQFYFLGYNTVDRRPHSFLGHYMTAAGLSMATLVLAGARLAFSRGPWAPPSREDLRGLGVLGAAFTVLTGAQALGLFAVEAERLFVAGLATAAAWMALSRGPWPSRGTGSILAALAFPISAWALVLSQTRNAWLGALAGLGLVMALRAPRALWFLVAAVALLLALRPATVARRLTVTDDSSIDRYYMWQAGIDMIREKPVFGQGPGMIIDVYPGYRWPGARSPRIPHLHDNALQIAAERGLPCLVWWLWFVAVALASAYREARSAAIGAGWGAAAAVGVIAAVMIAGVFEYNFGDSEILMFLLLLTALPYALRRQRCARGLA